VRRGGVVKLLVKLLMVLAVVGGLYAFGAYAERRANTPEALERAARDACVAMYDDHRLALGDEGKDDANDALRYADGRLDEAGDPDVVAIDEYLGHGRLRSAMALELDEDEIAGQAAVGHRLLVRAAQACTDLGRPELQKYLYDETGNEDYASVEGVDVDD
jgi:hypothetical protein